MPIHREATEDDPLLEDPPAAAEDYEEQVPYSSGYQPRHHGKTNITKQHPVYRSTTRYLDHFSLDAPSDQILFRQSAVRVYGSGTQQFQLVETTEQEGTHQLKAQITSDGSSGLTLLRAMYTLVSILMLGFLLIFCLQVLLFLFVSLVMQGGFTSTQNLNSFFLTGTLLSVPVFVYGLASALTMASEFVYDTFSGHHFFRSILRWNAVYIDWVAFAVFLGIPVTVMIFKMFTSEYWWETTALTWFACVLMAYTFFCLAVFSCEIMGALELLSHHPNFERTHTLDWFRLLKRAILIRQLHSYAGVQHRTFYVEGSHELPNANESYDKSQLADHEHVQERISWYTQLTLALPNRMFFEYDPPRRQYNIEDVLDRTVYVTDATWNLEKLFCRRQALRSVVVVNGPSRITDKQVVSSLICAIVGNVLCLLTFMALLTWAGVPMGGVLILTALVILSARASIRRMYAIYDTYKDTRQRQERPGLDNRSETIYQVTETHRLTRPSERFCWVLFGLEIFGLLLLPLLTLILVGNVAIAFLFTILGLFSALRHYFNAPVVLAELGSLDLLDGQFIRTSKKEETGPEAKEEDWREKNRLSKIVAKISQGSRRDMWMSVIFSFVTIFLLLFLTAYRNGSNEGAVGESPNLLHDFRYVQQDGFAYPTCSMTQAFQIPGSPSSALADYAYLASMGYISPKSTPVWLDDWFGEGVAVDDVETVQHFRTMIVGTESAVHYKLITFPEKPDFAVLTIRGTSNGWDMISDAQLWSAAFLAQTVRWVLPIGEVWNPILENLIKLIAVLQAESLKKVAFYVQTAGFVRWLRKMDMYKNLRITGHSLGGGYVTAA